MNLQKCIDYTVHLLRCAIKNEAPNPVPEDMDINELLRFCQYHKIENIAYYSLKKLNISAEKFVHFERAHMIAVAMDANQDDALKKISALFEQNGIDYMPLKGSVIKYLYPSMDMRQAADIDIYIGADNTLKAKEIMLSQGYTTDEALFGVDADDSYELGRYTRIELHRTLIPDIYKWKGECARIEASRRKNKEKNHLYEMTNEDFYIYMIIHLAKHMHLAGCGIKAILDIWIFLERYKDELDEDFIKQSLMNCGLDRFEKNVRKLAYVWFEHETCDDDIIRELSVHIAAGGWMGKDEFRNAKYLAGNYSNKEGKKVNKLKYYISCVFLKFDRMKKKYPVIEKHKYLLPVFWLVRLFSILLFKHNKIDEISENLDKSEEEIELGKKMLEFDKKIGL